MSPLMVALKTIPQMDPMNWLLLFSFFNLILIGSAVKVNFSMKAPGTTSSKASILTNGKLIFFI